MDDTTKKILEIVTDMQERMVTKDDISNLQRQINANTAAIADLSEQLRSVFGYAKEIDMLISRVSTLEKQMSALK